MSSILQVLLRVRSTLRSLFSWVLINPCTKDQLNICLCINILLTQNDSAFFLITSHQQTVVVIFTATAVKQELLLNIKEVFITNQVAVI